ncbi:CidA/LrgA family protein [Beduini massiliensis]|uniref:CidA/LrgA family protein n=1 Tax=Beduini massiliensis TaxID=1585974 RepID=UPI00059AB284|nr:CidA/LrgA family protein [Beduini massiliensis]
MGYLFQFMIISGITFIGELLHYFLPLPIPASVYGMVILFICLLIGIIKEEEIKETADFLLLIMPIMFVGPSVGVMENFGLLSGALIPFLAIVLVSTFFIMVVTGITAQKMMKDKEKQHE